MGTKRNPGAYDPYAAAGDDEPILTLRAADTESERMIAVYLAHEISNNPTPNYQRIAELAAVAAEMAAFRNRNK